MNRPGMRRLGGAAATTILALGIGPPLAGRQRREEPPISGSSRTIRSWGSAQMGGLMKLWERGFQEQHPGIRFEDRLNGTVSAIGGLYSGAADLALMGREIWPTERLAFEQTMGYAPASIEAATGSFDVPTKADALVIFVHKDNPISCLSMQQLDGIFGAEHRRGGRNLRTWSDLGLGDGWRNQPIQPYGYRLDNAAAIFFRNVVMRGSLKWNAAIREFSNRRGSGGRRIDSGEQILEALGGDRFGIAISNPHYARPEVKAVSLAPENGGACVAPTRVNTQNRTYPLTRAVYLFFAWKPGRALDPAIAAFLRYVLSDAGQQAVAQEGAYLPLPKAVAAQQLHRLETQRAKAGEARTTALARLAAGRRR